MRSIVRHFLPLELLIPLNRKVDLQVGFLDSNGLNENRTMMESKFVSSYT
jgi:hypothetical protein